jgi:hypothetical protein
MSLRRVVNELLAERAEQHPRKSEDGNPAPMKASVTTARLSMG